MPAAARIRHDDHGFSIVEVMIAMLILVVGLLGSATMLSQASDTSTTTQAREQAVALERELVEVARGIPYTELTTPLMVSAVQATPGLGDADPNTGGWQIKRRGITYTVAMGVCSVDDPQDMRGADDPATFCIDGTGTASAARCRTLLGSSGDIRGTPAAATAADRGDCGVDVNLDGQVDALTGATGVACPVGSTTCDQSPDDYKRIVTLVRWTKGQGARFALQSSTVPYPGFSAAPVVTALTPADAKITDPTVSSQAFTATTSRSAASLGWSLDGSPQGGATDAGGGTTWNFTFPLGTVNTTAGATPGAGEAFDGVYQISAQAFDRYGAYGRARVTTLTLNRRQPYKPINFRALHVGTAVALDWARSPERDVKGYNVYVSVGGAAPSLLKAISGVETTSWTDPAPPASANVVYSIRAVDTDNLGQDEVGDPATSGSLDLSQSAPQPPSALSAAYTDATKTSVVLTWTAAPGSVTGYRIYRDGSGLSAQYDTVTGGATTTYTDTKLGGVTHQYSIASIDANGAESTPVGPVAP
jgi:prepilin-type N-terminal cleavage/methylation domain-containing protein